VGGPSGTVTFLFTDIEGSTRLWEEAPSSMRAALARHDEIVRSAIESHGGYVFATGGDGFAAAFGRAAAAVAAAVEAQEVLAANAWPSDAAVSVRMGLHTGEVEERGGNYFGPAVNRAARLMAAGHGGQVLVSTTTAAVAPRDDLIDLGEWSFAGVPAPERVFQLGDARFPALRSVGAAATNLPAERTEFVGRERELGAVAGLVRSSRVVTLTGVGGVGKTRLALRVAAGMVDEFADGVWLAELAPLIDGALVPTAVAAAIGATSSRGGEISEVTCSFLAHKRALLVMDNCEHVIDQAAEFVDRLSATAPRLRVLATSREPLGVAGESVWRVPSMTVDATNGAAGDAVALFTARAAQVAPSFEPDGPSRDATLEVCRRLDGIPLAIELAAARVKVMSVEQIASRLDERFRLLTRGRRTAVARQQTLQGTIDWSYELLSPAERDLFDLLGAFAGEFDLGAISAVSGLDDLVALDLIEQLADKSMLEANPASDRYRLLETLRQYAWDRLVAAGRLTHAREAHAAYFSALAGEQGSLMGVPGRQLHALERLEADYDDLRAALAYLIERREAEAAARMVRRLIGLFNIRHPREGFGWFEQVITISDSLNPKARSRLFADAADAAMNAGDGDAQGRYARFSIELGGEDAPSVAHAQLSGWYLAHEEVRLAVEAARAAVTAADRTGNLAAEIVARVSLLVALGAAGVEAEVRSEIPVLMKLADTLGSPTLRVASCFTCGEALALVGHGEEALATFRAGLAEADLAGPDMRAQARLFCALQVEDQAEAAALLREALAIGRDELPYVARLQALVTAAKYAYGTGALLEAARLLGAYERHAQRHGGFAQPLRWRWCDRLLEQLGGMIPRDPLDAELAHGARLSAEQALNLAYDVVTTEAQP